MDDQLRRQYLEAMGIIPWSVRQSDDAETMEQLIGAESPARPVEPAAPEHEVPAEDTPPPWVTDAPLPEEEWCPEDLSSGRMDNPRFTVADLDWEALRERVAACKACDLHQGRTQTVFGVGNPQADLLVIGEAPGADEDRQGEPFVGRAGKLLNAMLQAIGFEREQVFIANILKCRPPGNRDPKPEEALRCEPFLIRQVELIAPKIILAVGRIAAQNLLKTTDTVGRLRGRIHHFGKTGIPLVVTYHPAYLLRSPEQKAKAWQDLQQVMKIRSEK